MAAGDAGVMAVRVDGFTVLEPLGAGGGGIVYLAEQHQPRRRVALKLLHSRVSRESGPGVLAAFERRLAALGALSHPGLAALLTSGWTTEGRAWLAFELVEGPDLPSLVREQQPSVRDRVALVAHVCDAIDHAHRRGVVHGDLKPINVRVDANGQPRVLDFDLPQLAGSGEPSVAGTPAYMAPEVALGEPAGEAADVHALGAMLHELLTGRPPLDLAGLPPAQALLQAARARRDAQGMADLDADLQAILDKALDVEQARRYPTAAALAEDLHRYVASLPILARPPGILRDSLLFARRHRRAVALAALVTASLVASAAALVISTARARDSEARLTRLRAEIEGLADNIVLDDLERRARDDLWPVDPRMLAAMDDWLAEARSLLQRPAQIRRLLAGTQLDAPIAGKAPGTVVAPMLRRDFADLLARLDSFADPEAGLFAAVARRREAARTLDERTLGAWTDAWRQCVDEVAGSPRYAGLGLAPQAGLVPLGSDRTSACAEFAVDGSGDLPLRDPASGSLCTPRPGDAIVLVLVPGGEHALLDEVSLVQSSASRPATLPAARSVTTRPFFISKYEFTQAQCLRLFGFNPSGFPQGARVQGQSEVTALHPVERITVEQARDGLRRIGLRLPYHTEWEVAARGGEGPCGAEIGIAALDCAANVADIRSTFASLRARTAPQQLLLDDGFVIHAPVGSYRPNGFGLHDTLGNVGELCAEDPPGTGATLRGHSCDTLPLRVDPAFFSVVRQGWADSGTGIRPARSLDP